MVRDKTSEGGVERRKISTPPAFSLPNCGGATHRISGGLRPTQAAELARYACNCRLVELSPTLVPSSCSFDSGFSNDLIGFR